MKKPDPYFFKFFIPLHEVLLELGGSATAREAGDLVIEKLNISQEELDVKYKGGVPKVRNEIAWARNYLVNAGIIESAKNVEKGIWALTKNGLNAKLTENDVQDVWKKSIEKRKTRAKKTKETKSKQKAEQVNTDETEQEKVAEPSDREYRIELLNILQNVSPAGFERICQQLLRASGFEQVTVTGKPNDGGIDGIGILQINPLVSFKVIFQCKRYQGSVGSGAVRDFRGTMLGRAEKGIILTTGTFTREAEKESIREGAPPIELVDGESLLDMFELSELGLTPKQTFDIDYEFFDKFK